MVPSLPTAILLLVENLKPRRIGPNLTSREYIFRMAMQGTIGFGCGVFRGGGRYLGEVTRRAQRVGARSGERRVAVRAVDCEEWAKVQ